MKIRHPWHGLGAAHLQLHLDKFDNRKNSVNSNVQSRGLIMHPKHSAARAAHAEVLSMFYYCGSFVGFYFGFNLFKDDMCLCSPFSPHRNSGYDAAVIILAAFSCHNMKMFARAQALH